MCDAKTVTLESVNKLNNMKQTVVNGEETSSLIRKRLKQSIDVKAAILQDEELIHSIGSCAEAMSAVISAGGKILICGNGGSASDALHMAGEIVGRFEKERPGLPALALNADVASMTAIANDYGYERIYDRAVEAYMTGKDILLGISTSGNSENVFRALSKAKLVGGKTAALLGKSGGKIKDIVDFPITVPGQSTARIQESHITIIHIICELIEQYSCNNK